MEPAVNQTSIAQSHLPSLPCPAAALWAELDSALQRLPAQWAVHSNQQRSYRLPSLELQVRLDGEGATALWMADSPVVDLRMRTELAQTANAWLRAITALGLGAPNAAARVQTVSSLLSAGFASVSVRGASELATAVTAATGSMAMAA